MFDIRCSIFISTAARSPPDSAPARRNPGHSLPQICLQYQSRRNLPARGIGLLPLGVLQLYASVNDGYFAARQLEFITNPTNSVFEWMRLPGDLVFIIGGVLPFLWLCWLGVRYRVGGSRDQLDEVLFTEITEREPVEAGDR